MQEILKFPIFFPITATCRAAYEKVTRASVLKSSSSGQLLKKQVVVFATHGLLAGDLPNLSQPALAMAATANPADSPLLTLEDVLSLNSTQTGWSYQHAIPQAQMAEQKRR